MSENDSSEASEGGIAIVGLSLRVTGARNVHEFWNNLVNGVESIRQLSDEELLANGESPERLKHPRYVKAAGILPDMDHFDPEFFGLSPKEGGIMDPQHRHLLECAWEALEDAGHPPETFDGPIGVWAGCGMGAYFTYNILSNRDLVDQVGTFLLRHTGNDKDFLATRVSYCLNLRGPSVNIQTACSTSLVAAHYACQSLLSGECDMALAGGVTIEIPHRVGYIYEEGEVLSPDGHCRAFDHRSAGTVFGSGAGMVVLRRLEDALRDGDQIYAVIKGSAVNNDGSGKVGYLAPSVEGQAAAIAEALAVSGVDADSIGYVECHGTGTAVGDPIEVAALTQAFRETTDKKAFCRIGSVKTNIGHLDTAAGVASLIKVCLALKHRQLPATVNFEKPNPHIDFASTPFIVNNTLSEFPAPLTGTRRRATVNSLGVGGTNAHVVLEEAPPRPLPKVAASTGLQLLVLSGRNRGAVDGNTVQLAAHLRAHPEQDLRDVAHALAFGRRGFAERRVLAARDREHAIALLESGDPRKLFTHAVTPNASVVFMFPGGGTQYPDMGRRLYETEPVFREHVDRGLSLLQSRVTFDARKLLFPDAADRERAAAELERHAQLPLIFIIEYALAQLWKARGVTPAALIGHSLGENTAAALAGVLRYEDALDLVILRGRLCDEVPVGGMLSVPMAPEALVPLLGAELDLACINGPELCVASGRREELEVLRQTLAARDVECQWLRIQIAGHSRMLDPVLGRFGDFLRKIALSPPTIPIISNRTGKVLTAAEATSPDYWVAHFRNTIRFGEGIATLLEKPGRVFLEVGPGRALCSLARMHPAVAPGQAFIGSLPHMDDTTPDHEGFLAAFGRLWAAGVSVDLKRVLGDVKAQHVELPTYAFQRQRYWVEPQAPRALAESVAAPARIDDAQRWYFAPAWRQHYPESGPDLTPRTFLVFLDDTGLGAALCDRLRANGDDVITVVAGDAFAKVSDHEYRLAPEHGAEGYETLIHEVVASGKTPDRIVHAWLLSDGETFRPGSSFFHRNQELGVFSLLFLAQALSTAELPGGVHLSVITRGMQDVAGNHPQYPEQATVLGPIKVMPRELPGVTCASIDLLPLALREERLSVAKLRELAEELIDRRSPRRPLAATDVDALFGELRLPPANGEVALISGVRWVKRYEPITVSQPRAPKLREGGVYLITGGLGGIAFTMAKSLAEVEHAKLVLVNRTPLPPREEWNEWLQRRPAEPETAKIRLVHQLEGLGAEVLVCAGDVADLDRMTEVVAETKQRFGALHGVVHAAGLVDDAPIAAKRQASVEAVLGPKVYGTLVLDRALRDEALDFFVLFSSTSTAIAAAGQVDYVAANAFLDAYADKARAEGRNVIALAWGVWADVGLAVSMATRMGADAHATHGHGAACDYPLFSAKWVRPDGSAVIRGTLEASAMWMLDQHRTSNRQAVVPGTGYLELARAALREVGHAGPFAIEDLYFLRPFDVPDEGSTDLRIRLKPTDEGFAFEVHSLRRAQDGTEGYLLHAQAFLRRFLPLPPTGPDVASIERACDRTRVPDSASGHRVKQERHLFFGEHWRVLRRYALGRNEAIAHLSLREDLRPSLKTFGMHPGLLDIATGFAIELESSYRDDRLWVPVSYDRVAVYADLTSDFVSVVKLRPRAGAGGFARFDITLVDTAGRVLVELQGFAMQALAGTVFEVPQLSAKDLERAEPRREPSAGERAFLHNLAAGITSVEGVRAFRQIVQDTTRSRVMVTPLDIRHLIRQADAISIAPERVDAATFERPNLNSEYIAPRNDVEKVLAGMWEGLLGVSNIGVKDDFFELGGHSLIAVRLFARITKTFGVDYPISVLIENPTIEACARLIAPTAKTDAPTEGTNTVDGQPRFKHLVPMNQPTGDKRGRLPFFLVAGMFGNVMNLRHLAGLVGEERPFHGLQARGLLGSEEPHETFEEMARDYIAEIRSVQPHGPYLLGGFSGGGLTAWEMARQLRAAGEEVPLVVMLDTPMAKDKPLTRREKLLIRRKELAERGPGFALEWVGNKLKYRRELQAREAQRLAQTTGANGAQFRSQVVEAAFYRALARYDVVFQPLHLVQFRPRLKPMIVFGPGSAINKDRRRIYVDNGWGPFADEVEVFETPGDHDSMVLEPNVRILAARLRKCLNEAEQLVRSTSSAALREESQGAVP